MTITNEEIPSRPLNVVVIVREPSGTGMYIALPTTLVMLPPGTLNYRVSASLIGGAESDNNAFNWTIHHQEPSNIEVAQAHGNVVTILPSGNQCNINAIYDGVARIRVSHSKSDIVGYITVLVTRNSELSFQRVEIELEEGQSEFVALNVPTYENFREKILYTSDNPDVAIAMGVSGSALIQAKSKGNAIIRAWIAGKEQVAELFVNVVEEHDPMVTRIVTAKTSYLFNPRSPAERISAQLLGLAVIDQMNDDLRWYPEFSDPERREINLYPQATLQDERGAYVKGRELQVSPSGHLGMMTITIGHPMIDSKYWKTVVFIVNEHTDALALDKEKMLIQNDTAQTLRATIVGGRQSDYDRIVWIAEWMPWNSALVEVVRIMGQGREVTINPIGGAEGTVTVTAIYEMHMRQCVVTVEAGRIFALDYRSVRMYPGELLKIPYKLRPASSMITWSGGNQNVQIGEPQGQRVVDITDNVVERKLELRALALGETIVYGIASGNAGAVTLPVVIAYDYDLFTQLSATGMPKTRPSDMPIEFEYVVSPPVSRVQIESITPMTAASLPNLQDRADIMINLPDPESGKGTIVMHIYEEGVWEVKLQLLDVEGNPMDIIKSTRVSTSFADERLTPFFYRYRGVWSNADTRSYTLSGVNMQKPAAMTKYSSPNISGMEENMFSIQSMASGNAAVYQPAGSGNDVKLNDYYVTLGDGEDHMILFDRKYSTSTARITPTVESVTVYRNSDSYYNNKTMYDTLKSTYGVVLDEPISADMNGVAVPGIRLSGGIDQLLYNRVAFDRKLYVELKTNQISGTPTLPMQNVRISQGGTTVRVLYEGEYGYRPLWVANESNSDDDLFRYFSHFVSLKFYTAAEHQDIMRNPANAGYAGYFIGKASFHPDLANDSTYDPYAYVSVVSTGSTTGTDFRASYAAIRINSEGNEVPYTVTGYDVEAWEYFKTGYMYQEGTVENPENEPYFSGIPASEWDRPSGLPGFVFHPTLKAQERFEMFGFSEDYYHRYLSSDIEELEQSGTVFDEAVFSQAFHSRGEYANDQSLAENMLNRVQNLDSILFFVFDDSEEIVDYYKYSTNGNYTLSKPAESPPVEGVSQWDIFGNNQWSGASVRMKNPGTKTLGRISHNNSNVSFLEYEGIKATNGAYYYWTTETKNEKIESQTRSRLVGGIKFKIEEFLEHRGNRIYVRTGVDLNRNISGLGYTPDGLYRNNFSVRDGTFVVTRQHSLFPTTSTTTTYSAGQQVALFGTITLSTWQTTATTINGRITANSKSIWDFFEIGANGDVYVRSDANLSSNVSDLGSYTEVKQDESYASRSTSQRYDLSIGSNRIIAKTRQRVGNSTYNPTYRDVTIFLNRGNRLALGFIRVTYPPVKKDNPFYYTQEHTTPASSGSGWVSVHLGDTYFTDGLNSGLYNNSVNGGRAFLGNSGNSVTRYSISGRLDSDGHSGAWHGQGHPFGWGKGGCNNCNGWDCYAEPTIFHSYYKRYSHATYTYSLPNHEGNKFTATVNGAAVDTSYAVFGLGYDGDANSEFVTSDGKQYVMQRVYRQGYYMVWHRTVADNNTKRDFPAHPGFVNTNTFVENKLKWEKSGDTHVVPISLLTQFPFEFNIDTSANGTAVTPYYTLKYGDRQGYQDPVPNKIRSTPMPSVKTVPVNDNSGGRPEQQILIKVSVNVQYHNHEENFNIWVDYKVRESHHLYEGEVEGTNGARNTIRPIDVDNPAVLEYQGVPGWGAQLYEVPDSRDQTLTHTYRETANRSKVFEKPPL